MDCKDRRKMWGKEVVWSLRLNAKACGFARQCAGQARVSLTFSSPTTPCTGPARERNCPIEGWRSDGKHSCCRWPGRSTQSLCSPHHLPPRMRITPRTMRRPQDASQCHHPRHSPSPRPLAQGKNLTACWHPGLELLPSLRRLQEGLPP